VGRRGDAAGNQALKSETPLGWRGDGDEGFSGREEVGSCSEIGGRRCFQYYFPCGCFHVALHRPHGEQVASSDRDVNSPLRRLVQSLRIRDRSSGRLSGSSLNVASSWYSLTRTKPIYVSKFVVFCVKNPLSEWKYPECKHTLFKAAFTTKALRIFQRKQTQMVAIEAFASVLPFVTGLHGNVSIPTTLWHRLCWILTKEISNWNSFDWMADSNWKLLRTKIFASCEKLKGIWKKPHWSLRWFGPCWSLIERYNKRWRWGSSKILLFWSNSSCSRGIETQGGGATSEMEVSLYRSGVWELEPDSKCEESKTSYTPGQTSSKWSIRVCVCPLPHAGYLIGCVSCCFQGDASVEHFHPISPFCCAWALLESCRREVEKHAAAASPSQAGGRGGSMTSSARVGTLAVVFRFR